MLIIGCDLHTRFQQIAMVDRATGELVEKRLGQEDGEAQRFYESLPEPALVGIESTGYTMWFAEMLSELGHELVVGDAAQIRKKETRQQKHDRRDAAAPAVAGGFSAPVAAQRGGAGRAGAAGTSASVGAACGREPRTACRRWR